MSGASPAAFGPTQPASGSFAFGAAVGAVGGQVRHRRAGLDQRRRDRLALGFYSATELPLVPGSAAAVAIQVALSKVGSTYVAGGSGPNTFDCSGLTAFSYAAAGVMLPHSSRAQSTLGRRVERNELQPGDLVFYYSPISHVALYIGNGMIVHARTYGQPVSVTSVDQSGYRFGVRLTG